MSGDPGGFLRRAESRMWAKGSWEEPRDQNIQGNSKEMLLPVKFERDTWQCHRHSSQREPQRNREETEAGPTTKAHITHL